ncbi:type III pantothenate kinase, partial [Bacillus pumilus]|uniref:type III pantothenate kinase n=1 Tax=Bacillus pumilus TaxID=1408 RepID=UPI0037040F91
MINFLLLIDVPNTNTLLPLYHNPHLNYHSPIQTSPHKTQHQFPIPITSLFHYLPLIFHQIQPIIISSLLPPIIFPLQTISHNYFHITPQILPPPINT